MKHLIFLGLLFSLFTRVIFAQSTFTISGSIVDSVEKKSIMYATVSLYADSAQEPINAAITQDDGAFSLANIPQGKYRIEVLMIGFRTKTIPLFPLENDKNMGKILLATQDTRTNEVLIEAKRPIIEVTEDKIVYNVGNDPNAKFIAVHKKSYL